MFRLAWQETPMKKSGTAVTFNIEMLYFHITVGFFYLFSMYLALSRAEIKAFGRKLWLCSATERCPKQWNSKGCLFGRFCPKSSTAQSPAVNHSSGPGAVLESQTFQGLIVSSHQADVCWVPGAPGARERTNLSVITVSWRKGRED